MTKLSKNQIKAIMAKHGVSNATPAQIRAMLSFESNQRLIKESKNNIPCEICGNRTRVKRGNVCFKCADKKHLMNAYHTSKSVNPN